jgi:hypothetical protein
MKRHTIQKLARRAVLAGIIVCHLTGTALAEPRNGETRQADIESAEAHAARAYAAYVEKDYEAAVRLYLEAYRAAPSPDILYNIARIYETGLGDRVSAIKFYRDFIGEPSADPRRVELASVRLLELEGDAEPSLPEPAPSREAPRAADDPAPVATPASTPALSSDGAPIALPPAANGSALHSESSAHSGGWSAWRRGALVTGSAGLVAVSVGAVFGMHALSQAKVVRRECDGNLCSSERGLSAARSAVKNADVATLSFALGGLLIATGATLLGIDLGASPDPEKPGVARWTATLTTADVGLGFSGRW